MNVQLSLERTAGGEGGDEQGGKRGERFLERPLENLPSHPPVDGMIEVDEVDAEKILRVRHIHISCSSSKYFFLFYVLDF